MDEELIGRIVLAVVMAATGVLLIWQARAAAAGKLRRNQIAGIRTAATLSSDEAWLAAHQRAKNVCVLAWVEALAVAGAVVLPLSIAGFVSVVLAGCLIMLALVLYGAHVGVAAARKISASAD